MLLPQTLANSSRNKRPQQKPIQNPVRYLKWKVSQKQSTVHIFQLFSQNIRSLMFDSLLNMPVSSMHFALTCRTNYFLKLIFGTRGANICMGMFL